MSEKELIENIKHLQLTQGLSDKSIGKFLGKSEDEIKYIRRKHKIDTSLRKQYLQNLEKQRVDIIKSNLDKCIKIDEMVKLTNISKSIVTKLMNKHNLHFSKKVYCIYCGKELTLGSNRKAKLCSNKCRSAYRYKNKTSRCKVCNKEIIGGSGYCSDECKRNVQLTCEMCNKEFKGLHSEKFCSIQCKEENERIKYEEYISREIEVKCEVCNSPMTMKINSKKQRICSVKCKNNYLNFRVNNSLEKLFATTNKETIEQLVWRKLNEKTS